MGRNDEVTGRNNDILAVVIAGPTASGKSAAAMAVAREFDGVVINADSMQIYDGMPLLTARPTAAEMCGIPHRLYGVLNVGEICSAARWREMAIAEIETARRAGQLPILCGGSGLYIKALMEGLSPIPKIPDAIRASVRDGLEMLGVAAMYEDLSVRDPVMADRLMPTDRQRISRAMEVLIATGKSLADWQAEPKSGSPPDVEFATICFLPSREDLYESCNARLLKMIELGAVAEVEMAFELYSKRRQHQGGAEPPLMKALGASHFHAYSAGELTLENAIEKAQQATRRYAKRQMTWLNYNFISQIIIKEKYSENLNSKFFSFVRQKLLTLNS